jgi:hypothetical protein
MLIEELIRLGRPLLDGDLDAQEVLELITDVTDDRVMETEQLWKAPEA